MAAPPATVGAMPMRDRGAPPATVGATPMRDRGPKNITKMLFNSPKSRPKVNDYSEQ